MKYFNFKRYKFSTVFKKINVKSYNFTKLFRFLDLKRYNFSGINKYISFRSFNPSRIYKYIDLRNYNFFKSFKRLDVKKYWRAPVYFFIFLIVSGLFYLNIPLFFKFDRLIFKNQFCDHVKIECTFEGKISYSFFPSPRINVKNLIIKDMNNKSKILGKIENAAIKISPINLHIKEKISYSTILLKEMKIDLDLDDYKKYKDILNNEDHAKNINLTEGEINFFQGEKYITKIEKLSINYMENKKKTNLNIRGDILNDEILIKYKNNKNDKKVPKIFKLKLLKSHFSTIIETFDAETENKALFGNIAINQGKNKFISTFDYNDYVINFKKSSLSNSFLDGKLNGSVKLSPFFIFDINLDLNSLNFNRLHTYIVSLDDENKKNLFEISDKINGKLSLLINKIFSKRTLINSAESQLRFVNGNILIEQFLISLGKLGAADFTGSIENKKKVKFFFETNIFIDNMKRFYNKFGIYDKEQNPANIFVKGNLDLEDFILHLHEISENEKFKTEDVNYIEKEFNNLLLKNNYQTLFNYSLLKEFVQSITSESN